MFSTIVILSVHKFIDIFQFGEYNKIRVHVHIIQKSVRVYSTGKNKIDSSNIQVFSNYVIMETETKLTNEPLLHQPTIITNCMHAFMCSFCWHVMMANDLLHTKRSISNNDFYIKLF